MILAVSKTTFPRAIWLVAGRCQATDLRAGRPSTPVVDLEYQARQRPSCAPLAAYYARRLRVVSGPLKVLICPKIHFWLPPASWRSPPESFRYSKGPLVPVGRWWWK